MSYSKYTIEKKKLNSRMTRQQRREKARRLPCCYHCGRTDNLITFKRADGRDITLCEVAAKMEGKL